jgi:FkbM family methyltransferase
MVSLRDVGIRLVAFVPRLESLGRAVYNHLPDIFNETPTSRIRQFFRHEKNVGFVLAGAHDGVRDDILFPIVRKQQNWFGVLIEPQPHVHAQLVANYHAADLKDNFHFICSVLADKTARTEFFYFSDQVIAAKALPDWASEIGSTNRAHLEKYFPGTAISCLTSESVTLADTAALLPGGKIDLLVMDIEGAEAGILAATDYNNLKIRFLVFEHIHMQPDQRKSIISRLQEFGFSIKVFGRDTIAWREQVPQVLSHANFEIADFEDGPAGNSAQPPHD